MSEQKRKEEMIALSNKISECYSNQNDLAMIFDVLAAHITSLIVSHVNKIDMINAAEEVCECIMGNTRDYLENMDRLNDRLN